MLILVTYDVNTESRDGQKRLRQVAKVCVNYGQRVQNSVFKYKLEQFVDKEKDSIRFYRLGNHYKTKVEHIGKEPAFSQDDILLI